MVAPYHTDVFPEATWACTACILTIESWNMEP